ncbi:PIN domain-containing protein [Sulfitobacter geojensis]|uniref:PIN domain-containing protein n=1 Tax=Sulfitobacter geojensis TaxID=1342299 RepID=UPI002493BD52|nr:type II toxin-antitoxin system VapC family toxin [Sulfitobacter geojensis]
MIALDTNVLARFLTQDEPDQARAASDLISDLTVDSPGFICREVLVELVWVLQRSYKFSRTEISSVLEGLLSASELVIEEADAIGSILQLYETKGFGFSDLMIRQAARRWGSHYLATFDKKAALLDGVELVELNQPQ